MVRWDCQVVRELDLCEYWMLLLCTESSVPWPRLWSDVLFEDFQSCQHKSVQSPPSYRCLHPVRFLVFLLRIRSIQRCCYYACSLLNNCLKTMFHLNALECVLSRPLSGWMQSRICSSRQSTVGSNHQRFVSSLRASFCLLRGLPVARSKRWPLPWPSDECLGVPFTQELASGASKCSLPQCNAFQCHPLGMR